MIGQLLRDGIVRLRAAGSELPRLDAELLLGHATGLDRVAIVAHPEATVGLRAAARYREALGRRERGEPVAYIRGVKEFRGLVLRVDARALIPRPETERLVELGGEAVHAAPIAPGRPRIRVMDVGTGSGAIAVALAVELHKQGQLDRIDLVATDRSAAALRLAAENVAAHGLATAVRLVEADLAPRDEALFDVLLANLPYIPSADVPRLPVAASFEPREALDGGSDGLDVIRRLLGRLPDLLAPGGTALFEIGSDQTDRFVDAAALVVPGWPWRVERDLSGQPRVAVLKRPELERSGMAGSGMARSGMALSSVRAGLSHDQQKVGTRPTPGAAP